MSIEPHARTELLDLAIVESKALPEATQDWLLAELTIELDRDGRSVDALELLRRMEPWLVEVIRARLRQSVFVADALLPFAESAKRSNDGALAGRLHREAVHLLTVDRTDIAASFRLAPIAARIVRETGDAASATWLNSLDGEARLGLDFDELERLRAANDPAWEPRFDSLEERTESLDSMYQRDVTKLLCRCGLPRAAFRHWLRTPRQLDADLLIALWRDDLIKPYQELIDQFHRLWLVDGVGDWSTVHSAVELAVARADAGDLEGARTSAEWARQLAEANAEKEKARKPEVAIWSLAHLLPLEMRLGEKDAAREVLRRCRAILAAQPPRFKHRATTLSSLSEGCLQAGFYDDALELAMMDKDSNERFRSQVRVVRISKSLSIMRAIVDTLSQPLQRLDVILSVFREAYFV